MGMEKLNELLALEQELDEVVEQKEIELPKPHTWHGERYVGGETRVVCTCGWSSKPAREKVTSRRVLKHMQKTGHTFQAQKEEEDTLNIPSVNPQARRHEVIREEES